MEIPGQYPRHMAFTVFGEDGVKQMNLRHGEQQVTIQFDIDAHDYNGMLVFENYSRAMLCWYEKNDNNSWRN